MSVMIDGVATRNVDAFETARLLIDLSCVTSLNDTSAMTTGPSLDFVTVKFESGIEAMALRGTQVKSPRLRSTELVFLFTEAAASAAIIVAFSRATVVK
jgi:hypothetical protein